MTLAHQGPEPTHVLFGQGAIAGVGEVAVEEGAEIGVEAVPVEAGRLFVFGVVGKHPPMLRPGASPPARALVPGPGGARHNP